MTDRFTRAEVELRIAALNKTLDMWKRDNGYARLISMEIWALELALAHLVRQELIVAQARVNCSQCGQEISDARLWAEMCEACDPVQALP
ncbi:MAG TPA: hypothetical protein VKB76_05885 [Ktedonobacterales bacterium]|nr:hypothetical protein [Ktedonobacterales bacterium]